ncbi:hypothetical protein Tco_0525489 [Tanacetum coccineum]
MDEMYRVTTSFLQREVAAFSHSQKKAPTPWRQPKGGNKPNFKKGFKNKQRSDRKPDRFSLLTKSPKEIFALEKGKFKAPPPMVTPAEKRDPNKYYEFHADTGHSTNECMQLRRQIEEMIKSGEEDETEGPMIIEAEIGGHFIHRIYVDRGASSEVLYEHCFVRLRPEIRSQMIPATTSLIGFSGETIWPLGQISLLVKIGDEEHSTSAWMNFMEEMFLGYKVNAVCPEKVDAVLSLPSQGCLKDVQKLNGKLARSRSSLQTDKETHCRAPNADRTKGKGGANHVLSRGQGSYQCSLNDRKGGQANASVLCEPRPTRAGDQLHPHGKNGVSLAQRKKAAEKILSGTHNCRNHRSADKATAVKLRNHRKDGKVEN